MKTKHLLFLSLIITSILSFFSSCEKDEVASEQAQDLYRIYNHSSYDVLLHNYSDNEIECLQSIDYNEDNWIANDSRNSVSILFGYEKLIIHKRIRTDDTTVYIPEIHNIFDTNSYIRALDSSTGKYIYYYFITDFDWMYYEEN